MHPHVNIAIQIIPLSTTTHPYDIIDIAIKVIEKSGLTFKVCPFETVVEGDYYKIMNLVEAIHKVCYEAGANEMICNLKIQSAFSKPVTINEKMNKYL